jgi:hypothetical protein
MRMIVIESRWLTSKYSVRYYKSRTKLSQHLSGVRVQHASEV